MSLGVADVPCPCGGVPEGATLTRCCGPFLAGEGWPPTPERLMRSRYTAYVVGAEDHLFWTWHPASRPGTVTVDAALEWTGLRIVDSGVDGPEGHVEFVATWRSGAGDTVQDGRLHERSRFVLRAGRWVYRDGTTSDT